MAWLREGVRTVWGRAMAWRSTAEGVAVVGLPRARGVQSEQQGSKRERACMKQAELALQLSVCAVDLVASRR